MCYGAVALKNRFKLDDALDVWGVHGVGGMLGIILLGVFSTLAFNPKGADGLLRGNATFFGNQVLAVAISSVWAFVFTWVMLWVIDRFTRVRVTDEEEDTGLDEALHGETAYIEAL